MHAKVTDRGQVSIPAAVRKKLQIKPHTVVEWVIEGNTARMIPLPDDPIAALRGSGKAGAVRRLIADRRKDRRRGG